MRFSDDHENIKKQVIALIIYLSIECNFWDGKLNNSNQIPEPELLHRNWKKTWHNLLWNFDFISWFVSSLPVRVRGGKRPQNSTFLVKTFATWNKYYLIFQYKLHFWCQFMHHFFGFIIYIVLKFCKIGWS